MQNRSFIKEIVPFHDLLIKLSKVGVNFDRQMENKVGSLSVQLISKQDWNDRGNEFSFIIQIPGRDPISFRYSNDPDGITNQYAYLDMYYIEDNLSRIMITPFQYSDATMTVFQNSMNGSSVISHDATEEEYFQRSIVDDLKISYSDFCVLRNLKQTPINTTVYISSPYVLLDIEQSEVDVLYNVISSMVDELIEDFYRA